MSQSPTDCLLWIQSKNEKLTNEQIQLIVEAIDHSPFSLEEWKNAVECFPLDQPMDLINKVEYINCCIQGSYSSVTLIPLAAIVSNYLETYGIEYLKKD